MMDPGLLEVLGVSADGETVLLLSAFGFVGVCLWMAAWTMGLKRRGLHLSFFGLFLMVLLTGLSRLLLGWIPWIGPALGNLLAWFLDVCVLEELHQTSLGRAAVCLGVAGFLSVFLGLVALGIWMAGHGSPLDLLRVLAAA